MLIYVFRLVNDFWFRQFVYDLPVSFPIVVSRRWPGRLGNPILYSAEKQILYSKRVCACFLSSSIEGEGARRSTSYLKFDALSVVISEYIRVVRKRSRGMPQKLSAAVAKIKAR